LRRRPTWRWSVLCKHWTVENGRDRSNGPRPRVTHATVRDGAGGRGLGP
jgi:hypothetical protein